MKKKKTTVIRFRRSSFYYTLTAMSIRLHSLLFVLINLVAVVFCADEFSRLDFPPSPNFVFGAGTSAYQYEGAASEDGRTSSIWDTFARAGNMNGVPGDVAIDGYHKYKEDVQLMVETGLEAYRFSIAWSRLIPNGRGPVNPKGLEYYNNVINELVQHGIEPHVTMVHLDVPQALEDEYGGWLSRRMVKDFTAYADVCFREFGDRVLHWTTLNEANVFVLGGYDNGQSPPGRCSSPFGCSVGNSSTEPYIAAHNILLGHASAARLYRLKYQNKQHGFIGINLYSLGYAPYTNTSVDMVAAQRTKDYMLGWFLNPLVYGDYPVIMKERVGSRLPSFTGLESENVKGSFDFLGLNYYLSVSVKDNPSSSKIADFDTDMGVEFVFEPSDTTPYEYPVTASGLVDILEYIKNVYGNPPIYIHENGQRMSRNASLNDTSRIIYMHNYVGTLLDAMSVRNGVKARGYFHWSFVDLIELLDGETSFGLYYVNLDDEDLKRYPKLSARWYSNFLKGKNTSLDGGPELEGRIQNLADSHFLHQ